MPEPPGVVDVPDVGGAQFGALAVQHIDVAHGPVHVAADLVDADLHGLLEFRGLVRRRRDALQEIERRGLALQGRHRGLPAASLGIDAVEDPVVLARDLADLGVRFDAHVAGKVARLALVVHFVQQVEDFGAGAVLGHVEADALAVRVDP